MSNIKPGDIVIFKAGNTWISKTIAWLTESDVSHAAIVLEDGRIAEMGPDGSNLAASPCEAYDCLLLCRHRFSKDFRRTRPHNSRVNLFASQQRLADILAGNEDRLFVSMVLHQIDSS